jgi:hypothetical protein
MDAITAYQLTSMMQGVVERGTAARAVNLPCRRGQDRHHQRRARTCGSWASPPTSWRAAISATTSRAALGRGASGGGMCGPVFNQFMEKAIEKYGGGPFEVPPGGRFIKIDRFSGARLPDDAHRRTMWWPSISATAKSRSSAYVLRRRLCDGLEPAWFRGDRATGRPRGDHLDRRARRRWAQGHFGTLSRAVCTEGVPRSGGVFSCPPKILMQRGQG